MGLQQQITDTIETHYCGSTCAAKAAAASPAAPTPSDAEQRAHAAERRVHELERVLYEAQLASLRAQLESEQAAHARDLALALAASNPPTPAAAGHTHPRGGPGLGLPAAASGALTAEALHAASGGTPPRPPRQAAPEWSTKAERGTPERSRKLLSPMTPGTLRQAFADKVGHAKENCVILGRRMAIKRKRKVDFSMPCPANPTPSAFLQVTRKESAERQRACSEQGPGALEEGDEAAYEATRRTCYERCRDRLLELLSHKLVLVVSGVIVIGLVGWGAFFALLGIGALPMFTTDERNYWMNFSIQILTAVLTYLVLLTAPWRIANLIHLFDRPRSRTGLDFYGRSTELVWFNIPRDKRLKLVGWLLLNTVMQFFTQATRILWPTYEESQTTVGAIVINVAFVLALLSGVTGGVMQLVRETQVRMSDPARFDRSPITIAYPLWIRWRRGDDSFCDLLREFKIELRYELVKQGVISSTPRTDRTPRSAHSSTHSEATPRAEPPALVGTGRVLREGTLTPRGQIKPVRLPPPSAAHAASPRGAARPLRQGIAAPPAAAACCRSLETTPRGKLKEEARPLPRGSRAPGSASARSAAAPTPSHELPSPGSQMIMCQRRSTADLPPRSRPSSGRDRAVCQAV